MTMPAPKTDGRERRSFSKGLELRAEGDGESGTTTKGYACLFNNVADIGGYWQERFAPGAFGKSLGERDVVALHSHDDGRPMGRMSRDTLRIAEDDKGLRFENDLPDTQDGRDLATSIDRGDIEGMSFRFRSLKEEWDETQDPPMRTVIEAELYEITYTAFPAYPDTEVGMRSLEHARREQRNHNKSAALSRISMRQAQAERNPRSR
ncbi:HK97 family phage prohead protease [Qipengyuania sp. SM2507]